MTKELLEEIIDDVISIKNGDTSTVLTLITLYGNEFNVQHRFMDMNKKYIYIRKLEPGDSKMYIPYDMVTMVKTS